jgi:hypothetical protein
MPPFFLFDSMSSYKLCRRITIAMIKFAVSLAFWPEFGIVCAKKGCRHIAAAHIDNSFG